MGFGTVKSEVLDLVDFHSHILPGVDHGSTDIEMSLSQLKLAASYSVKRILATPHFYPNVHTLSSFLELRNNAAKELKKASTPDLPEFRLGAEVLICDGLERFPDLDKLCFENTKYIMLELPFFDFSESYAASAEAIADMGYKIILAHADRYPKDAIEFMLDYGVSGLQINADSLVVPFKKKGHIYKWISEGLVCALGSDIHATPQKAYKNFYKAQNHIKDLILPIKKSSDKIWKEIKAVE